MDNDNGMKAGLLLLKYPCIESYLVSSFQRESYNIKFGIGTKLKKYIGQHSEIQMNKISEETLRIATEEFMAYLQYIDQKWDIDDFSKTSRLIFDMQEEKYASSGGDDLFSILTLSFIQLGIIEVDQIIINEKK